MWILHHWRNLHDNSQHHVWNKAGHWHYWYYSVLMQVWLSLKACSAPQWPFKLFPHGTCSDHCTPNIQIPRCTCLMCPKAAVLRLMFILIQANSTRVNSFTQLTSVIPWWILIGWSVVCSVTLWEFKLLSVWILLQHLFHKKEKKFLVYSQSTLSLIKDHHSELTSTDSFLNQVSLPTVQPTSNQKASRLLISTDLRLQVFTRSNGTITISCNPGFNIEITSGLMPYLKTQLQASEASTHLLQCCWTPTHPACATRTLGFIFPQLHVNTA